ncbi:MAG: aminoacyl-tRNA hydrolase [Polyangiales bacterium]
MFLVAGLGNPGPKYAQNRHNLGFLVVERFADRFGAAPFKDKFKGRFTKAAVGPHDVVLLEPLTYMNLSGESVQPAMAFFRVEPGRVICVHDELDLPYGTVRIKVGGGAAGHNGLKSLIQHCGQDFVRIRMGIGRPPKGSTESYVLGDFPAAERAELPDFLDRACDALEAIVRDGVGPAMNKHNQKA